MSIIKNFDPMLFSSHFEAVRSFIKEGRCAQYDFNVCSKRAAENAIVYLDMNNIPYTVHSVGLCGFYCVTIAWKAADIYSSYCFYCEEEL